MIFYKKKAHILILATCCLGVSHTAIGSAITAADLATWGQNYSSGLTDNQGNNVSAGFPSGSSLIINPPTLRFIAGGQGNIDEHVWQFDNHNSSDTSFVVNSVGNTANGVSVLEFGWSPEQAFNQPITLPSASTSPTFNPVVSLAQLKIANHTGSWKEYTSLLPSGVSNVMLVSRTGQGYYSLINYSQVSVNSETNINSISVKSSSPSSIVINANTSLGSVVSEFSNNQLNVAISAGSTLKLTGTPSSLSSNGFDASADNYSGLGSIDFGGNNGTLTVATTDGGDITLNGQFLNAGSANMNVVSSVTATDSSIGTVGNISTNNCLMVNTSDNSSTVFTGTISGWTVHAYTPISLTQTTSSLSHIDIDGTSNAPSFVEIIASANENVSKVWFLNPYAALILDS